VTRDTVPVQPETLYTRSGDVSIAYQVTGEGPFDVVFIPPFVTHVELVWTTSFAPALEALSSFCRLIRFDKRGTGMSDRVGGAPTLETRMDDARAVMDAAGSSRAAFFGSSEGAAMSLLFAATYPERTAALVLRSAYPRTMWAPDYPWGRSEEEYRREMERDLRLFGSRDQALEAVRSRMQLDDDQEARQWVDYLRWSGSPGAVEALALMNKEIDVRHVLPAIRVPTLILHGSDDTIVPIDVARYVGDRISGARRVEVPTGHAATGRAAVALSEEIKRFLTEVWESGGWEEAEPDRVLATVLFTDIVGASERAASLGDRAWRELLERHHELVRRQLVRFRGREVDTAGDGFFASFDGQARAIRCACAIVGGVRELGLDVRAGLHTGECELVDGKVAGIAVHTGARVASYAQPGEVLVSSTVKDLVAGSGIAFEDRGAHELKGIPGEWRLYAVER
jgi:pimeloyl-ACP methyl ester carboxylesterase